MSLTFQDVYSYLNTRYRNVALESDGDTFLYHLQDKNSRISIFLVWEEGDTARLLISACMTGVPGIREPVIFQLVNLINCKLVIGNFQIHGNKLIFRVASLITGDRAGIQALQEYLGLVNNIFDYYYPSFQELADSELPPTEAPKTAGYSGTGREIVPHDILKEVENYLKDQRRANA